MCQNIMSLLKTVLGGTEQSSCFGIFRGDLLDPFKESVDP